MFSIKRNLLSLALKRVEGGLQKNQAPTEPGRYIIVGHGHDKLALTVTRVDMIAKVTLDNVKDISLLDIGTDTYETHAVHGENFSSLIGAIPTEGLVRAKFTKSHPDFPIPEEMDSDDEAADEAAGVPKTLRPNGAMNIIFPVVTRDAEFWLQCVGLAEPPEVGFKEDMKIVLSGGEFLRLVAKVGVAVRKDTQSLENSQVLIRCVDGQTLDVVAFSGTQLAWARHEPSEKAQFKVLVPYDVCLAVAKMLDPKRDVCLYKPSDKPEGLVIFQDVALEGGSVVGKAEYRLFSVCDKFTNFGAMIKGLSFKYGFKAKKQQFENVMKVVTCCQAAEKQTRTVVSLDHDKGDITFALASSQVRMSDIALPVTAPTDKSIARDPIDLEVSSAHVSPFIMASTDADGDEVELLFTSRHTLAHMVIGKNFETYFQPFGKAGR